MLIMLNQFIWVVHSTPHFMVSIHKSTHTDDEQVVLSLNPKSHPYTLLRIE
jgi:hypothetical protein